MKRPRPRLKPPLRPKPLLPLRSSRFVAPTSPARDATAGSKPPHLQAPPLWRPLAAPPYEALLMLAIAIAAAFPTAGPNGLTLTGIPNLAFKLFLLAISAASFLWLSRHGG